MEKRVIWVAGAMVLATAAAAGLEHFVFQSEEPMAEQAQAPASPESEPPALAQKPALGTEPLAPQPEVKDAPPLAAQVNPRPIAVEKGFRAQPIKSAEAASVSEPFEREEPTVAEIEPALPPEPARALASQAVPVSTPEEPVVLARAPVKTAETTVAPPEEKERETASVPVTEESSLEPDPVSHLQLDTGFHYFRLDATDKNTGAASTLLSDLSPEVRLSWRLDWSKKWTSFLRFAYQSYKISDDTSTVPRSIQNASGSRTELEAGLLRSWTERSRTGLFLGFKEYIFEHSPTTSQISIDKVRSPSLKITHEIDLARYRTVSFGSGLSGAAIFPGRGPGYDTETGYGGDLSFYLRHEFKKISLEGSVYYGITRQNSSLVEQKESHMGAVLGLSWRLGD